MPKNSHQSIGENIGKFLWTLRSDFPKIEVYIGLPPGFKFDPAWSQEERDARVAELMSFTIMCQDALTQEQKDEIRKRVAEKFIHFLSPYTINYHTK